MRIFVVGTGRCGTVTFARAAKHATNYVATHESTEGKGSGDLAFADNRIEVNPYLSWMLGPLLAHNQVEDVMLVHLQRKREEVIASWIKRGRDMGPGKWTPLVMRKNSRAMTAAQYRDACGLCYDSIVSTIDTFLRAHQDTPGMARSMHIWLHEAKAQWPLFWRRIGAKGDYKRSLAEWNVRHNRS